MSDVHITIPTHPHRTAALHALRCQLAALPWVHHVHVSLHDDSRRDVANAISMGLRHATAQDWLLYLEDDAYLGTGFTNLPALLATCPPEVACAHLFQLRRGPPGWDVRPGRTLSSTVALAFRVPILTGFVTWVPSWYAAHPHCFHASDLLFGAWLQQQHARLATYRPNPVQHRPLRSVFVGRTRVRQSPSYRDAYGAVPALIC